MGHEKPKKKTREIGKLYGIGKSVQICGFPWGQKSEDSLILLSP